MRGISHLDQSEENASSAEKAVRMYHQQVPVTKCLTLQLYRVNATHGSFGCCRAVRRGVSTLSQAPHEADNHIIQAATACDQRPVREDRS